jgi:hypothetical protein
MRSTMATQATYPGLGDSVGYLLSLGLTQLSIQVTLSTSLTASAASPRLKQSTPARPRSSAPAQLQFEPRRDGTRTADTPDDVAGPGGLDLVVIDTPPLTAVSDAFPLLGKVDGVVIVGRVGRNRRDVAQRLHDTLSGAGAPLLGVIANGFKTRRNASYAYAYNYPYRSEPPSGDAGASPNGAVAAGEPVPTVKT